MRTDLFDVFVRGARCWRLPLDQIGDAVLPLTLGTDAGVADAAVKLRMDLRRGSTPEAWAENDWQAMSPHGPLIEVRKMPLLPMCLERAMTLLGAVEAYINSPDWQADLAELKAVVEVAL